MIGPWTEIEVEAVSLTPLHIGCGESEEMSRGDAGETVQLALVAADAAGAPIVPGATLKGILRSTAGDHPAAELLFGPRTIDAEAAARSARLICWTGRFVSAHDVGDQAGGSEGPAADRGAHGLFTDARTTIDPASGTAAEGRLFHRQAVAAGVRFRLRLGLQTDDTPAIALLQALLGRIAADGGLGFGSGGGIGYGRLRASLDSLTVIRHGVAPSGSPTRDDESSAWRAAIEAAPAETGDALTLTLTCHHAYISLDSERARRAERSADADAAESNVLRYLREPGSDRPRLTGATLRGALRARAVWLERLRDGAHRDNRDLILDQTAVASDHDLSEPRARCQSPAELSTTERLFGVNGWRGQLRVRSARCTACEGRRTIHSVKLDRFAGGPMHGALFAVEAALAPTFEAVVGLEERGPADPGVADLFARLVVDLRAEGLELGHGTNKGYGWFDVR